MPGTDGLTLYQEIRETLSGMQRILLISNASMITGLERRRRLHRQAVRLG